MSLVRTARSPIAATLAVAGLLFAGAATAASPAPSTTVEGARVAVQYGDLNLDTERGAAALHRRLVAASRQVCGWVDHRDLRLAGKVRECADAAIARAVAEVGSPRLARLHAAGRGRSLRG